MKKQNGILIFILLAGAGNAVAQRSYNTTIAYDELGQMAGFGYPDGSWVDYVYDNEVGVASQVTYESAGERHDLVQDVDLDESGLVTRVVTDGGEKTYAYDSLSQLVAMRFDHGGVTRYQAANLAYNHLGGLKSLSRQDGSVNAALSYGYTEQGQLRTFALGGATATYRYDARGNLTAVDGFTSGQLQVPDHDAGAQAFDAGNHRAGWQYDAAGRLLRDDARQYYYDATGRLAMVRDLATGLPLQTNLYDGAGNRIRSSDILAGSVTYSIRDANGAVVAEVVDNSNEPDRTTNTVQHQGRAIAAMTRVAGAAGVLKTLIFTDHLGSPAVTVAANLITNHEYGPFGVQLRGPEYAGAHGYTGHEDDAATALTYMMARYYDAAMARFLTPDPARDFNPYLPASLNLYEYVWNDPITFTDPTGTETGYQDGQFGIFYYDIDGNEAFQAVDQVDWAKILSGESAFSGEQFGPLDYSKNLGDQVFARSEYLQHIYLDSNSIEYSSIVPSAAKFTINAANWTVDISLLVFGGALGPASSATLSPSSAPVILSKAQKARLDKIYQIAHNLRSRGGLSGKILDPGHIQKFKNHVVGLTKSRNALDKSLSNPNLFPGTRAFVEATLQTADDLVIHLQNLLKGL